MHLFLFVTFHKNNLDRPVFFGNKSYPTEGRHCVFVLLPSLSLSRVCVIFYNLQNLNIYKMDVASLK